MSKTKVVQGHLWVTKAMPPPPTAAPVQSVAGHDRKWLACLDSHPFSEGILTPPPHAMVHPACFQQVDCLLSTPQNNVQMVWKMKRLSCGAAIAMSCKRSPWHPSTKHVRKPDPGGSMFDGSSSKRRTSWRATLKCAAVRKRMRLGTG